MSAMAPQSSAGLHLWKNPILRRKGGRWLRLEKKGHVSTEQQYLPRVTNSCVAGLGLKLFSL